MLLCEQAANFSEGWVFDAHKIFSGDIPLKDKAGDFLYSSYCQQISCAEPNQQLTDLLTSIVCVSKAWYIVFLYAVDLRCCPKTIENMSVSHITALGDMSFHYEEFGHVSLFRNSSKN